MDFSEVTSKIGNIKIIPVVVIENADDAIPLAQALIRGGLSCAEITFRTDAATKATEKIAKEFPEMLIGSGTVLTCEQVERAVDAGAKFIVSPGLNPKTVEYCLKKNVPIFPGVATASEIELALSLGLSVVKFFPAENLGGINMIKALAAPFSAVRFIPTGGINASNIKNYLSFEKVLACGGSWMVSANLISEKQFEKISTLTAEAVELVN